FGMVALEAMACGTPVVASKVGGLRSTIVAGENGFLVPAHDAQEVARRIRQILDSDDRRRRLGQAGVAAASRYRWPGVARQFQALYLSLMERPDQARRAS